MHRKITSNKLSSIWKEAKLTDAIDLQNEILALGIQLEIESGNLYYDSCFKPLTLSFELVFVRHGETYGNCGQSTSAGAIDNDLVRDDIKDRNKRIYQGDVDTEVNQLTEEGKRQSRDVAEKLTNDFMHRGWVPDVIFVSPLNRAKETAMPFITEHGFENRYFVLDAIREMSFGAWDNRRVCDINPDASCHLFYRNQHALVQESGINGNGNYQKSENFCEVLLRAHNVLTDLNAKYAGKKILMFSHSMFGAACCILLGRGQRIEYSTYLAFDGEKSDGTHYTMKNATPIAMNFESPRIKLAL